MMTQSLVDCVHTRSGGDDHADPCAGESAPGGQA